jgi:hypothetical protein
MKSVIRLLNKSLIMSNIKRFWWVSALYFIILTIIFLLRFLQIAGYDYSKLPYSPRYNYTQLIEGTILHSIFIL